MTTFEKMFVHMVWHTKHDRPVLYGVKERFVHDEIKRVCTESGMTCFAVNSAWDHTHVLLSMHKNIPISDIAKRLKGRTAFRWNKHHASNRHDKLHWQSGYTSITIRQCDIKTVQHYIRRQKEHHCEDAPSEALREEFEHTP